MVIKSAIRSQVLNADSAKIYHEELKGVVFSPNGHYWLEIIKRVNLLGFLLKDEKVEGNFDLTVTTQDVVLLGDTVTFEGTLKLDKDFGAGYLYPVIIEDANTVDQVK